MKIRTTTIIRERLRKDSFGTFVFKPPDFLLIIGLWAFVLNATERAGFDLPSICNIFNRLILQLNSNERKELSSLVDLLFSHDFLLSRDPF